MDLGLKPNDPAAPCSVFSEAELGCLPIADEQKWVSRIATSMKFLADAPILVRR